MSANGIKIAFGGGLWLNVSVEEVTGWLDVINEVDIKIIDTAQVYGASEELIGKTGAPSNFTIDTKLPGAWSDKPSTKDGVIELGKACLKRLNTESVDILYMHCPDRRVNIKDTLEGFNELYKQGAFKRLGLSNYSPDEVEETVRVAKENGLVVPSVYQGNYSAIARRADHEIFPILRKHKIAFYCYSPIAGGFLAKSKAALFEGESRFKESHPFSKVYNAMYNRPSFIAALDEWANIAEAEKVSKAELAYRWVAYHSKMDATYGDVIIVGASSAKQLKDTVKALGAGPLSEEAVKKIDQIWESIKGDAFLDNFEGTSG